MAISLRNWIQKLVIGTHIWVSLNCALLGAAAGLWFSAELDFSKVYLLGFITLAGYSFYALKPQSNIQKFMGQKAFILFCASLLCIGYIFYQYPFVIPSEKMQIFGILLLFSLLYQIPYVPFSIRSIPYFKIFYIATMWALWIVFLIFSDWSFGVFFALYFFVFAITIPFDIRDLYQKELTLPQRLGVQKSVVVSLFSLCVSCVFWLMNGEFNFVSILGISLAFVIIFFILRKVRQYKKSECADFYINFWVEVTPFILMLGVFLPYLPLIFDR